MEAAWQVEKQLMQFWDSLITLCNTTTPQVHQYDVALASSTRIHKSFTMKKICSMKTEKKSKKKRKQIDDAMRVLSLVWSSTKCALDSPGSQSQQDVDVDRVRPFQHELTSTISWSVRRIDLMLSSFRLKTCLALAALCSGP